SERGFAIFQTTFSVLGGGYGIAVVNSTITNNHTEPNQPRISISVSLIHPNKNYTVKSFLIYQSTDKTSQLNSLSCGRDLTSSGGYMCILSLSKVDDKKYKLYWTKILFLSTG